MSTTVLVFDTETTGLPDFRKPAEDPCQPWMVQLAWVLVEASTGRILRAQSSLIHGVAEVPAEASAVNGITPLMLRSHGVALPAVLQDLCWAMGGADVAIAHNVDFDRRVIETACHRSESAAGVELRSIIARLREQKRLRCTLKENTAVVGARFADGRPGKWPTLAETHAHYFGAPHESQHDALGDVQACARVFLEMERRRAAAAAAVAP